MSEYIAINDGVISGHFDGPVVPPGYIEVPDGFSGMVGQMISDFDPSWRFMPREERLRKGLLTLEAHEKLEDGMIVVKTHEELVRDGLAAPPPGMKLEDGQFVGLTYQDKVKSGEMTEQTAYILACIDGRLDRNRRLQETDWTQLDDQLTTVKELWAPYRKALKDVPQQPGFPWKIEWPVRPDGVVS